MEYGAGLRICLLSYRSNPYCGGQGVYLKNLSLGLKELGHEVEIVSGPPDPMIDEGIRVFHMPGLDLYNPEYPFRTPGLRELLEPVNLAEWLSVSTMGFPEPMTFGIRAYRFLRKRFGRYDIVHDNQSLSYGVRAIGKFVPTIATVHHPITIDRDIAVRTAGSFLKKLKEMRWYSFIGMQKRVARKLLHIITVSMCARDDISRDFKIPKERFTVIPNGINTDVFYRVPEIAREKDRVIVTNSADMPLKGLDYLLKAVARVSKKRSIRLVVVGSPKKDSSIVRLIEELGIGNVVKFTGRIDDKQFVLEYAKACVAVVPSVYEGFGLPAGEAMACGVPVISTRGGALPEVVGDAGILVEPENDKALARSITEVFDNPAMAGQLGNNGYKRIREKFTWRKAAEKTVEVYRSVIAEG